MNHEWVMAGKDLTFGQTVLLSVVEIVYRMVAATWRIRLVRPEWRISHRDKGIPYIFGHWHEDDLSLVYPNRHLGIAILISLSRDGSMLASVMSHLGFRPFRGSSSRGGARGLLKLIRAVRSGNSAILTVDGPRGPRRKVKAGIIMLARKTGTPIVVVGAVAKRRFVFRKSWSQTFLPLPFTRLVVGFSRTPIAVPGDADDDQLETIRLNVEKELHDLHDELAAYL